MGAESHWYVSGYKMTLNDPVTEKEIPLFVDETPDKTMFRVVVKSNLTRFLMDDLLEKLKETLKVMDTHFAFRTSSDSTESPQKRHPAISQQHHGGHVC